jgi:hypothetical protein
LVFAEHLPPTGGGHRSRIFGGSIGRRGIKGIYKWYDQGGSQKGEGKRKNIFHIIKLSEKTKPRKAQKPELSNTFLDAELYKR